jgi:broad specificity phosphatase PhoE
MANANLTIGQPDTPLAEEGLAQARTTGQDLRSQQVTAIVCSSFIRAQQTAEIIAGELGIAVHDITIIDELHERRMGELEGGPKNQETQFFYENDTEFGFESQADLIARLRVALAKVTAIAEQTSGTTVVVGHATSGFYLLQVAKGRNSFAEFDPVNQMGNAEFVEIELA